MDSIWLASRVRAFVMLTAMILAWSISTEQSKQPRIEKFSLWLEVSSKGFSETQRVSDVVHLNDPRVFIGS